MLPTTKQFSALIGFLMAFCCISKQVQGTFYIPNTSDTRATGSSISAVNNTGNSVYGTTDNGLHVMVWDGSNAQFAWDDQGTQGDAPYAGTSQGLDVEDPDVVVDPAGTNHALIVYIDGNTDEVYYEVHEINGSNSSLITGPTQVSSPGNCETVNVDVSENSTVPIVYECNNNIFARFSSTFISPSFLCCTNTTGGNGHQINFGCSGFGQINSTRDPDVAIDPTGDLVSISYIYENSSNNTKDLIIRRVKPSDIINNSSFPNCPPSPQHNNPANFPFSDVVGAPRIAAPWNTNASKYDCHVVVQHNNDIVGFTHDANVWGNYNFDQRVINSAHNINNCSNLDPATAYVGDFIIDVWTYDDAGCGNIAGDKEVLARQLHFDGTPQWSGDYSMVNNTLIQNCNKPSIAGRYMAQINAKGYYCYWDQSYPDIMYKSDYYSNQQLKTSTRTAYNNGQDDQESDKSATNNPAQQSLSLNAYPNPFQEKFRIQFSLDKLETAEQVRVFNIEGKQLWQRDISSLQGGDHQIKIKSHEWDKGMYLVRLGTDRDTHTMKVLKQ